MNATALVPFLPPASLAHARELRDDLRRLLSTERAAAADFIVALADFDQRRGWEPLGHASLFAFLHRELGLSKGAAYLRFAAARLLPRFPEVEAALREGRLCLSAVGELARVLTLENRAEVLPRFFGCSSREAREVAAALVARDEPPRREVVTAVPGASRVSPFPSPEPLSVAVPMLQLAPIEALPTGPGPLAETGPSARAVRAHELALTQPARARPLDECEPLDADLRRLHITVSRRLLDKVVAARDGLSHALPGATTEQVLEAALDSLLEKQARAKALVRRPRASRGSPPPSTPTAPPTRNPRHIPAAVEREVRLRDGNRCLFPLNSGGVCGSTFLLQLDHIVPVALGGQSTVANLRCTCAFHNRYAAELALGPAVMEAGRSRPGRADRKGRKAGRAR